MSRSTKKGPFVDPKLAKKVAAAGEAQKATPIQTWSRASMIAPQFIGFTFLVHNGRTFTSVTVTEDMVGHRLGEFAPTRVFRGHRKKEAAATTAPTE